MKVRSFVLVACMLVVPAAAMFSHRIPPAARKACWRAAARPIEACLAWAVPPEAGSAGSEAPVHEVGPIVKSEPPASREPAAAPAAVPPVEAGGPAAAVDPIRVQLAAHGATSIECRPLDGEGGACVASCHVAIDSTGQLLRVFQAVGPGSEAACRALLDDVAAWRRRTSAGDRVGTGSPSAAGVRR